MDVDKNMNDFKEWKLKQSQTIISTPKIDYSEEPASKEMLKLSLKERFLKIILEGTVSCLDSLDELWEKNPDKFSRDASDEKFLFNQKMPNGQTLLYIASREGSYRILKYMLDKNLNAKIKSKVSILFKLLQIDENNEESCLQVAARWGYFNIVDLLLEKVDYEKEELKEAINQNNINQRIIFKILNYFKNKFERKEKEVVCFC